MDIMDNIEVLVITATVTPSINGKTMGITICFAINLREFSARVVKHLMSLDLDFVGNVVKESKIQCVVVVPPFLLVQNFVVNAGVHYDNAINRDNIFCGWA
jgi:hypothetical protein